jgi:hypothetical protein
MLIVTVCMAFIIAVGIVSYLLLVQAQNRRVSRSLYWHMSLAHAEAGVEEALAQLNHAFGTNVNRAANGWGGPGGGVFGPVTRSLKTGAYRVTVSTATLPQIVSTGYATNPITGDTVARTVEVQTRFASAFQVGMAAKLNIDFQGNNIRIDSFDSADPTKSTSGEYDPAKAQANGDVASTDGFVSVGNANVHGKIRTGPNGSYTFGPNGFAGPIGWTGKGLYSPDWYANDFNADFKDVEPPFTSGFPLPSGSDTNDMIFTAGDYYHNNNLKKTGTQKTILVTGGLVRLYVTGDFQLPLNWEIKIEPGSTFKVYVGQPTGSGTKGEFGAVNTAGGTGAATFQYYGLPSNTAVTWIGNNAYKGTVYAPQATFTCGGGGSDIYDYQGACVVNNAVLNGKFNFHFDEDLKKKDPYTGYTAGSWREL